MVSLDLCEIAKFILYSGYATNLYSCLHVLGFSFLNYGYVFYVLLLIYYDVFRIWVHMVVIIFCSSQSHSALPLIQVWLLWIYVSNPQSTVVEFQFIVVVLLSLVRNCTELILCLF